MRQILFRGKSTGDLGTWIYGYYHYDNATEQHCILDKDTLYKYDVIPETVGQFTGELDKYGDNIFEGDIVSVGDKVMKVVFRDSCFRTITLQGKYRLSGWSKEVILILGNYTDNPELLNQ